MNRVINLTSDPITYWEHRTFEVITPRTIEPCGLVAKVEVNTINMCLTQPEQGLPVVRPDAVYTITGLPSPQQGTWYIVSADVFAHVYKRPDVITPSQKADNGSVMLFTAATKGFDE
jgi:hypothetical protein